MLGSRTLGKSPPAISLMRDAFIIFSLGVVAVLIGYQVRPTFRIDMRDNNLGRVTGFYYFAHLAQSDIWTGGDARFVYPDIGVATPLLVSIDANAWRDAQRIYGATVTANGHVIGAINRANWRTWQFKIDDPSILDPEQLVIGIQSDTFVPSEISDEWADPRALGIQVQSVQVQPLWTDPGSGTGWMQSITIPPLRQLVFLPLLTVGLYVFSLLCALGRRTAIGAAIGLVLVTGILVAFFRLWISNYVLVVVLIVGAAALLKTLMDARARLKTADSARSAAAAWATWTAVAAIIFVAAVLRLQPLMLLASETDEDYYVPVAAHYAADLATHNWLDIALYDDKSGHPALVKLIWSAGMVVRDAAGIDADDLSVARNINWVFGVAKVGLLALVNPLAGWLLAIQTDDVKYSTLAYLESLPALAAAVSILAYERFRRTETRRWLYVSAIALGVVGASKFIYLTSAIAIFFVLLWEKRKQPRTILSFVLVAMIFGLVLDPYLWPDPIGRFFGFFSFHVDFSQHGFAEVVKYPWYRSLLVLTNTVYVIGPESLHERPPVFLLEWDKLILIIGILGLPSLWKRSRLFILWIVVSVIFLIIWPAKWDQYAMILTFPLCLAASYLVVDLFDWITAQLARRRRRSETRIAPGPA